MLIRQPLYIAALVAAALGIISHARAAEPATGEPLLVGVHYDAAKQASYYSLGQKSAFDVFASELNANGGIRGRPLKLLYEDDELNPVVAATKAEKLAAENVLMLISISGSATGLAVQKKAEDLKIPVGSPGNFLETLTTVPPKHFYFRFAMRDSVGAQALIKYFHEHFNNPKFRSCAT